MATYNGEKYIHKQLESILQQLMPGDEIVVSDDQSTDKTLAIIDSLADSRIKVSQNCGLKGPLGNFEQAIKRAKSSFIILADQDDVWLPGKVDAMRLLLQDNDLVLSDCQVINGNGELIHASFFKHRRSHPGFWKNLYRNSYVGCCMAFRRDILTYVLPFPSQIHMHDWWIGLLVEAKGKVCFYPKPLIHYVRHGNNASPTGETGYSLSKKLHNRLILLWYVTQRLLS